MMQLQSEEEIAQILAEFENVESQWGLRINKKKTEILQWDGSITEILGIKCVDSVKYLGLMLHTAREETDKGARSLIRKNLGSIKKRLSRASVPVKEALLCAYVRSLLVYCGAPLAAAGIWTKKDIDSLER